MQQPAALEDTTRESRNILASDTRLFLLAVKLLRKNKGSPNRALNAFLNQVQDDQQLLRAMALAYLEDRSNDGMGAFEDRGESYDKIDTKNVDALPRAGTGQPSVDTQLGSVGSGPTITQRTAAAAVKTRLSETVLDTFTVSDGRPIGDITLAEIPDLRGKSLREAYVLGEIQKQAGRAPSGYRVREIVDAAEVEEMLRKAQELLDGA